MNIKVFNIRLGKEFCQIDQDKMNKFLDSVEVKLTSTNFVTTGTKDFWSAAVFYLPKTRKNGKAEIKFSDEDLSPNEANIFKSLRNWRNDLAQKLNWSSFRICHNSHLVAIAKANPQTIEELEVCFGKNRTDKYGDDILAILNAL
ncbi:MAG: HRDC domain-containing protein [Bacteroidota bacterium]